jgi:hypothetical protein
VKRRDTGAFWFCLVVWFGLWLAVASRGAEPTDRDLLLLALVGLGIVVVALVDLLRAGLDGRKRLAIVAGLLLFTPVGFLLWWRWGISRPTEPSEPSG